MTYIKDAIRFSTAAIAIAGFTAASHGMTNTGASAPTCNTIEVSVYFEPGEARLSPFGEALISEAANALKGCEIAQLQVTGYADVTGDAATNVTLSKERASTVAAALTAAGIEASQTSVTAKGETNALTADGQAVPMQRKTDVVAIPARGEFG